LADKGCKLISSLMKNSRFKFTQTNIHL
jgi:hypothetical protein